MCLFDTRFLCVALAVGNSLDQTGLKRRDLPALPPSRLGTLLNLKTDCNQQGGIFTREGRETTEAPPKGKEQRVCN